MNDAEAIWQLWIDTGGTFTDLIARSPDGETHALKVLSSSEVRLRIVKRVREDVFMVETGMTWQGIGIRGLRASARNRDDSVTINSFDSATGRIELSGPLTDASVGGTLTVFSDEEAPLLAARLVTGTPREGELPPIRMRLATTRGTNALLERRGARTALITTRGFRDLLLIGDQTRPDLFAQTVRRPEPLPALIIEFDERLDAEGNVLNSPSREEIERIVAALDKASVESIAISLLHAYRNSAHEECMAEELERAGWQHVSRGGRLVPRIRYLPRTETAVINAYLTPVIREYLRGISTAVSEDALEIMTSTGALVSVDGFEAMDSLLSGPAGGIVGAATAAARSCWSRIIGFDMGGTSTDVARYDGTFELRHDSMIAGLRHASPMLAIETVAAGGGSICDYHAGHLRVGPESAGASPGPACYGAGGPLTITDVNLLLGRITPERFAIPLDADAAQQAIRGVQERVREAEREATDVETLLDGFLSLADERMAEAIRQISIRRGYDPVEHALVSFGGAGGQHACRVAERLGIVTVLMPASASLLSAFGLGHARYEHIEQKQVLELFETFRVGLPERIGSMRTVAERALRERADLERDARVSFRIELHSRLEGQETSIVTECGDVDDWPQTFADEYERMYGFEPEDRPIEIESMLVIATAGEMPQVRERITVAEHTPQPAGTTRLWSRGAWHDASTFERDALAPGDVLEGPAMIHDQGGTLIVESGWRGRVDTHHTVILSPDEQSTGTTTGASSSGEISTVDRELFTCRVTAVAEEVGEVLQRMAVSTNVKERRDYSCAVLDHDGRVLANAAHIPVHLGAMGMCVRALRGAIEMQRGDVIVTNHPGVGGSHLPDVTVVTPVLTDDDRLLGYLATRAHHAEIGGRAPGSMPPDATSLAEEGVVIRPMHLVRAGRSRMETLEGLLRRGPFPSRAVTDNLADIRAAMAANHRGAQGLRLLAQTYGVDNLHEYMNRLQQHAASLARRACEALGERQTSATDTLDDGSVLAVRIDASRGEVRLDFTGTSDVHPGNLNATPAIVRSAVLYVLRLMIGESLPLSEGLMEHVEIVLPRCMLNPDFLDDPTAAPAVVGGNTETSQRLVNLLLRAFDLQAASQGTMNNVIFGDASFGYYETIGGGCGATAEADGASGVHSHMTNTRLTDPEILEHRYPVRVESFELRHGSGGAGRHCGGDGIRRELRFLKPLSLSVLTQHRTSGPRGLHGGADGQPGRQTIHRADGDTQVLRSVDGADLAAGDRLVIETPGGGGFGSVES